MLIIKRFSVSVPKNLCCDTHCSCLTETVVLMSLTTWVLRIEEKIRKILQHCPQMFLNSSDVFHLIQVDWYSMKLYLMAFSDWLYSTQLVHAVS